jgi:hypothetical protein
MMAVAVFGCLAACGPEVATLMPTAPALGYTVQKQEQDVGGVRVTVVGEAWPGAQDIRTVVTPLRIVVENKSQQRVRFRYEDVALQTPDGKRYQAIPLPLIGGSVERPSAVTMRGFYGAGFWVSGYYAPYYPDYPYTGAFGSPWYGNRTGVIWERVELPTPQMVARGIPEGVIDPGGHVDGFVYFQKVPPQAGPARFVAQIVTEKGAVIGKADVPFLVGERRLSSGEMH